MIFALKFLLLVTILILIFSIFFSLFLIFEPESDFSFSIYNIYDLSLKAFLLLLCLPSYPVWGYLQEMNGFISFIFAIIIYIAVVLTIGYAIKIVKYKNHAKER